MKHGPIALIDRNVPVIAHRALGPAVREDREQPAGSGARAAARWSCFSDAEGVGQAAGASRTEAIVLPKVDPFVAPILLRHSRCSCWPITSRC
jgi:glucosamine 6-phosphate synthetase-like amidotransferase/phosphosugar isomerase protein